MERSRLHRRIIHRVLMATFMALCSLAFSSSSPHATIQKNVAVVFLKHVPPYCPTEELCLPIWTPDDVALIQPPRHSASSYEVLFNNSISSYYKQNSLDNVSFHFTALVNPDSSDGFWDAPHKIYQYVQQEGNLYHDGLDVAYQAAGSSLANYDYLVIIHNYHGRVGQSCAMEGGPDYGPADCPYSPGSGIYLGVLFTGEDTSDNYLSALVSHELGHMLGLPDQYSASGINALPGMGMWDLMADDPYFNHFGGWTKNKAGWISSITDLPCSQGGCEVTASLRPLELPGAGLLRVPVISNPFVGYMAECRLKAYHDDNLPESGVLITNIDPMRGIGNPISQVDSNHLVSEGYEGVALQPGEVFVDNTLDITISYLNKANNGNCVVKAERGISEAPDPSFNRYTEEENGSGGTKYKSPDIWIDSEQNGWDVFPLAESFGIEEDITYPAGYGDPFWVGHINRIGFKVRNTGFGPAENVTIDVFVTQPLTFFIPGITCEGPVENDAVLIDTVQVGHLDKGEVYKSYVNWTPQVNASARIKLVIRDIEGEISHSNNTTFETYILPYVISASAGNTSEILEATEPDTFAVATEMKCIRDVLYRFKYRYVSPVEKRFWGMNIDKPEGVLVGGGETEVQLVSLPPEGAQSGTCADFELEVSALVGDVFLPVDGAAFRKCVVDPATLTCISPLNDLEPGQTANITGSFLPSGQKQELALEYTDPKGNLIVRNVSLSLGGNYRDVFKPDVAGQWQVRAYFQGSDSIAPAQSEPCMFKVGTSKPEFTLDVNSNCREGPGMAYEVATAAEAGYIMPVEARSEDSQWLFGMMLGERCWIYKNLGTLNMPVSDLPVRYVAPLLITPTPDLCASYTTRAVCNRYKARCQWIPGTSALTASGICVSK